MAATITATTTATNLHQVVRGLRTQQFVRANANTLAATTTTGAFPVSAVLVSQRKYVTQGASGTDRFPSS
jgi:ABC-type maltose transport system permease subunit